MTPNFDALIYQFPYLFAGIENRATRPAAEGVWFTTFDDPVFTMSKGIWWTDNGKNMISLYELSDGRLCNEIDRPRDGEEPVHYGVCPHASFLEAEDCALTTIRSGHPCRCHSAREHIS